MLHDLLSGMNLNLKFYVVCYNNKNGLELLKGKQKMSMGVGARARLADQDNETVIYNYYGYNINFPDYRADNHSYDGYIIIPKSCFVEPEIHQKIKRMPSGKKKLIIKRVPVDVDYEKMIEDGLIEVQNCSNCWKTYKNNIDYIAFHIIRKIFYEYQEEGNIPNIVVYMK